MKTGLLVGCWVKGRQLTGYQDTDQSNPGEEAQSAEGADAAKGEADDGGDGDEDGGAGSVG